MKVRVRSSICQGHSMCLLACPETFTLDEITGHASTHTETAPPALEVAVEQARASCPEGAIETAP